MKRLLQLLGGLLVVSVFAFSQGTTITLLHVNDTHSHLDAFGPKDANLNGMLGGIARAATVIGTVKGTESNVLLLHGGDVSVGDPFYNVYFGVPEYQLMLQLGFDAMAVGNHEFDFGPGPLNDVLTTAFGAGSFPLLSANLNMDAFPALKTWIQPSMMKTVGGVKIGIIGLTVPGNPTYNPAPVIVREDIVQIAQQTADTLRTQGARVIILLSHCGIYLDKIVAANTAGIDFIIGAHDHFLFEQPVMIANALGKKVPIFQAGEFYKYVGELHFTVDDSTVTMNDYKILPVDSTVTPDPTIQAVIENLKAGIVAQYGDLYHTELGRATHDLNKRFDPASPLRDTPIGNLVTDAFHNKTKTDVAITALGLISEKLYAGPIVGADVFRSLAYGYDPQTGLGLHVATLKIRGSELLKGLEFGLSQLEISDDVFLQVSGMTYAYDPKRPVGSRVIMGSIKIGGRPFIPHAIYSATVSEGVVLLLGKIGITVEDVQILPDFEFTTARDYIQKLETVNTNAEGRIWDNSIHPVKRSDLIAEGASSSNYPNPFNPTTTIRFTLPSKSYVSLKIYDVLGRQVAALVQDELPAGTYSQQWNASLLPSGVYFYRLQAGGVSDVKKMSLIR
jgi:5'-nucleotidase